MLGSKSLHGRFFCIFDFLDFCISFLIGAFLLSYATNYWFLWRNDTYLKYFQQFEKETFSRWNYMYLFLFHAGILIFGIVSIHMTIGFNF
jgi:hypothetical protein